MSLLPCQPVKIGLIPLFVAEFTVKSDRPTSAAAQTLDVPAMDQLTGGAFTAPTTGERTARVRDWLATSPSPELMADVFRELSHRDKGAARPLKEKLDDIKRARLQDGLVVEWAQKAEALLAMERWNVADAMAWQRDAAKAGAPLSREPLAGLKVALADRIKAVDDLQHRIQVAREAAVLLAQRIEVLSTKPLEDSTQVSHSLAEDVSQWVAQAQALAVEPQWPSMDVRFANMLETSRTQLMLVWEAFDAALKQAVAAVADATAPLPAVPVWADAIRLSRGEAVAERLPAGMSAEDAATAKAHGAKLVADASARLAAELAQGHGKTIPKLASELRHVLKEQGRWLTSEVEVPAQALLAQAGDMEGWQRWRADQLRQELVAKAEALTTAPEGQRLGGRKMQEVLRGLRESWKQADHGGAPNHALWKRFDEACNQAHKLVEEWLGKLKAESAAHKAQRMALIQEVLAWAQASQASTDWKAHARELHRFAETWRNAGHLSEKQFADIQPQWTAAMDQARAPLEAAQTANLAQRHALIEQAVALGVADVLRMDAVRALQHDWQHLAQAVPLERRLEQKLWDAFRKPIDDAFARKDAARAQQAAAMSEHDQRVVAAAQALQAAIQSQDAQAIQAAMSALENAAHDQAATAGSTQTAQAQGVNEGDASKAVDQVAPLPAEMESVAAQNEGADVEAPAAKVPAPARKIVAVRGDDRPGMKKAEPAPAGRPGRHGDSRPGAGMQDRPRRDNAPGRAPYAPAPDRDRGPRLGDAAFRARRDAMEHAQLALKKLSAQAHGQSLTQLLDGWKARDAALVPPAGELGGRVNASARQSWIQAVSASAKGTVADEALLRLEMAAEVPSPAGHVDARRALQLKMLTRRNDPAPAQTWQQDAAQVFSAEWDAESARRLQHTLKVLMKKV